MTKPLIDIKIVLFDISLYSSCVFAKMSINGIYLQ